MHYHREAREEFVNFLIEQFPKCFSKVMRQPLKKNIILDLEKRQTALGHDKLEAALSWYTNDFSYQRCILAGADRIDLDGKKAGSVTLQEQQETRMRMTQHKAYLAERRKLTHLEAENMKKQVAKPTIAGPAIPQLEPTAKVNGDGTASLAPPLEQKPLIDLTPMRAILATMEAALTAAPDKATAANFVKVSSRLLAAEFRKLDKSIKQLSKQ